MKSRPPRKTIEEREAAILARHPELAAREASKIVKANPFDLITLGIDDAGRALKIDDTPRLEHMHVIGATGCGKSTFLLNCILQDIARGRGVCVLDPHGGHPDSLLNLVLRFLRDHQWLAARNVHIIAPNTREQVVGLNPLAPLPNTDPAVIAGAMLEAFSRVWGDEDTHKTPLTRRILRNVFTALAETGHPLADAAQLLDYADPDGYRQALIAKLKNENAIQELQRIERLSKEPRGLSDFEANVLGPTNRLAEFLACEAMRLMFSMTRHHETPDNTLDLLNIIDRGHILLVDLQHGPALDEAATDLLGKIILRYLFLLSKYRRPYVVPESGEQKFHPFFVYVDEAHRYMTDDVEGLLKEVRKFGMSVSLAHQYLAQLGNPGDTIYEAVRNSTETKVVFRVKSPEEAQTLAYDVLPLSLELPVQASIRPTQIGFTIGELASDTYSVHEGEGISEALHAAEAIGEGRTEMQHWMSARGRATGSMSGTGSASSTASGFSSGMTSGFSSMASTSFSYDPNTMTFITQPMPLGMVEGTADGSSQALMSSKNFQTAEALNRFRATNEMQSLTDAQGGGVAINEMYMQSRGKSSGVNKTRGTTHSKGSAETLIPVYADLPTSFHSKDNELYMKGEMIRALPVGRAVVKFRSHHTFLNIPPPRKSKSSP
jgi:Helicase HerA, central domain